MKFNVKFGVLVLLFAGLMACKIKPQPIAYGSDGCHFCSMTIVDRQHSAELVTQKGKVYKFDAVECLINYLKEVKQEDIGLVLVSDYSNPGELTDATTAVYLISEGIPSPMGAYLTAFAKEVDAYDAVREHTGELYTWVELKNHLNP